MDNKQRLNGYYWCRCHFPVDQQHKWSVYYWSGEKWYGINYEGEILHCSFIEVSQYPIKSPEPPFIDKDMGHGKCVEKGCNKFATTDYNGHGHWVCESCDKCLNDYFDEEYR